AEHPIVGIRPGEKVHEEMVTESDSFNTVDLGKYYAILPSADTVLSEKYLAKEGVVKVPEGFCYNSGTNTDFLSVEEIREL
ncbi:polysaccharide biosynthesis protein, partial [Klebsiella pneumoniae]|nr:polysaccharide biosynthesis protein [Klebsiella pneumoniae]